MWASKAVVLVLVIAINALPTSRGDSSVVPHVVSGLGASEGKSRGLLNSLEALFKKNSELLGKLRVELNDFSDGLESLRELANTKLVGAFYSPTVTSSSSAQEPSALQVPAGPNEPTEKPAAQQAASIGHTTAIEQVRAKPNEIKLEDPYTDREGLRTSTLMERGDESNRIKRIRRSHSEADIVLTEEDEQNTKPMDEVVCFMDLDKCTIYGPHTNIMCPHTTIACVLILLYTPHHLRSSSDVCPHTTSYMC